MILTYLVEGQISRQCKEEEACAGHGAVSLSISDSHVVTNLRTGHLYNLEWESRKTQTKRMDRFMQAESLHGQTKCQESLLSKKAKWVPLGGPCQGMP